MQKNCYMFEKKRLSQSEMKTIDESIRLMCQRIYKEFYQPIEVIAHVLILFFFCLLES